MRRFIEAPTVAYLDLKQRCQSACLIFNNCEYPPACTPETGRVGFEKRNNETYAIMVDHDVNYSGSVPELKRLFDSGEINFSSFLELEHFLKHILNLSFNKAAQTFPILDVIIEDEPQKIITQDAILTALKQSIVGQDHALVHIADMTSRHLARHNPLRPTSIFMLGSTGVGKTKSCEALANYLNNETNEVGYLRLDMCEYQEAYRVSQLIGSPQGYTGHGESAQLAQHLAHHPRSIILFDEIEKAHPDILTFLMNAMDAGRLSSPKAIDGKHEIDCRQAIFMFTSNLYADSLISQIPRHMPKGVLSDSSHDSDEVQKVDQLCREHLIKHSVLPEVTGRIQSFVLFYPLNTQARAQALALAIRRIGHSYGVNVAEIEKDVLVELLKEAQKNKLGSRVDEYLADRRLGHLFIDAFAHNITTVKIHSSPLRLSSS